MMKKEQMESLRQQWFSNVPKDILSGLVVALALIPEAIAFSIIAGVDPKVGLYAAFCIATISAFVGGRPAMISAATGAMALVMVDLVKDYGLQYLLAASILAGVLQITAGYFKAGVLMRFVSKSVVTGFVNALAILIFCAQLPELYEVPSVWLVYTMVAAGLAMIYLLPYVTKAVPSPLIAICVLTAISVGFGFDVNTVGDMGQLPDSLPMFLLPEIPWSFETLQIIFPVSVTLAMVGLLESMMTAQIVDEMTDTPSDKNQECMGQGISNIVAGFFGGMAGCAMIGQSVINVKSGGRGRLSTLCAGVFLLILVVFLGPYVSMIPMAALVAVMIMVSIGTFKWESLKNLILHPKSSSAVMVSTVVVVVMTGDLAQGVLVGVLLSGFFFAHKVGKILEVDGVPHEDLPLKTYNVSGQVFFASADRFVDSFDYHEQLEKVHIDVSDAHFWDITAIGALDKVVVKYRQKEVEVEIIGLNEASAHMVNRFAIHDKPDADKQLVAH